MFQDPILFQLHHGGETGDLEFWCQLAEEFEGPVLELGCGTGRLMKPLARAGRTIVGLDLSLPALTYLKNSLAGSSIESCNVFQSRIDQFHLSRKFSLIFLACNTLSTLPRISRKNTYLKVFDHLDSDGVFAASFPNPSYMRSLPAEGDSEVEETLIHPLNGNPIQVSSEWHRKSKSIIFDWHYDLLLPDGQVIRQTVSTEHSLAGVEDYLVELYAAGLEPFHIFGDYQRSELDKSSPFVILLAKKAA
jgi:SAM-dependent methyltransferase